MRDVEVFTVYAPRRQHPKWRDYLPYIRLQRATAEHFKHRHLIISDGRASDLAGLPAHRAPLPDSLMHAQLAGVLAYLEQWSGEHPAVYADADVLIARSLAPAFDGRWDIGITNRREPVSPINNGVMYFAPGARQCALRFFEAAYRLCGEHWGGDQEAIGQAAAPVPEDHRVEVRHGARVGFLPCRRYNMTPLVNGNMATDKPFAVHFKGDRKRLMNSFYAQHFC